MLGTLSTWIVLLLVIGGLIYYQFSLLIFVSSLGLLFVLCMILHPFYWISVIIFWIVWGVLFVFLIAPKLRRNYFSRPVMHWVVRHQPSLSSIEQQTLQVGAVGWEKEFFSASPDWSKLLNKASIPLNQAEQNFLDNQVEALCRLLDECGFVDQDNDLPEPVWNYIKTHRFWALVIHPEYGGYGFSPVGHAAIISKIATRSYSVAISVMVPNSLGPAELLQRYGTEQQKQYYLPRLAIGQDIPCFALTSPEAGSDATSILDNGVVCYGDYQGAQVLGIRLNWIKRYITLAPVATLIGLAFRLYDPDQLLGEQSDIGISLALIPADHPGVMIGRRHKPLNLAFMNGPLAGHDVFIPLEWLVGGVEKRGQGWLMMMECLAIGRAISLPSLAVAGAAVCFIGSSAYAVVRQQFHRSIGQFELVQAALARIGAFSYLSLATQALVVQMAASGESSMVAASIAKYHLTELGRKMINDAMDIHGGRAIQSGLRNYLVGLYQAAPISITVEGANLLTRGLMIFGQGVLRCHPFLQEELVMAGKGAVAEFDPLLVAHISHSLTQFMHLLVSGVTRGRWIHSPVNDFSAYYYRQLTRMSTVLQVLTDVSLLVLGKKFKEKELLSARLGDILSHLYLATAVLKYFSASLVKEEQIYVEWNLQYCLYQIQQAIVDFLQNFPVRWLSKLLSALIFCRGKIYHYPDDDLSVKIAKHMQKHSVLRDHLTALAYTAENSALGKVELAMQNLLTVSTLLQKVMRLTPPVAIIAEDQNRLSAQIKYAHQTGILTDNEYQQLQEIAKLCWDAILVDEF